MLTSGLHTHIHVQAQTHAHVCENVYAFKADTHKEGSIRLFTVMIVVSDHNQLAGFYCSRVKTITIINSSILFTSFHEILLAFKSFKAGLLFPVVTTSMPGPEISSSQCPLTVLKHAYVSFLLTLIQAVSKLILSNKTAHLTDLTLRC